MDFGALRVYKTVLAGQCARLTVSQYITKASRLARHLGYAEDMA